MVWRDLPRLRDPLAFEPWLRVVLVHATRHALRRDGGVRLIRITDQALSAGAGRGDLIEADRVVDGGLEPGASLASRDALARAFARLSIDHRAILALHHLERYRVDQIAVVLRRPVWTVKLRGLGERGPGDGGGPVPRRPRFGRPSRRAGRVRMVGSARPHHGGARAGHGRRGPACRVPRRPDGSQAADRGLRDWGGDRDSAGRTSRRPCGCPPTARRWPQPPTS